MVSNRQNYGLVAVLYNIQRWLRKQQHTKKAKKTILADMYLGDLPSGNQKVLDTRFLAVDCEMTGLSPNKNQLISIGWIEIAGDRIEIGSAHHTLIYSGEPVEQSARIHGLQDHQVAGAASIARALTSLAKQTKDKVVLFHHAPLDLAFLQKAAMQVLGCPLYFAYLDTLKIEQSRLALSNNAEPLQLNTICQRYGLPPSIQHNAVTDARATAELFLAQCAHIGHPAKLRLKDLGIACT